MKVASGEGRVGVYVWEASDFHSTSWSRRLGTPVRNNTLLCISTPETPRSNFTSLREESLTMYSVEK